MSNVYPIKIHWLAWQPTPYNASFFREISKDSGIDLFVHYRVSNERFLPWQSDLTNGYANRTRQNNKLISKFNIKLISTVFNETNAIYVVAGWPGFVSKLVFLILILSNRKYIYWTDTGGLPKKKLLYYLTTFKIYLFMVYLIRVIALYFVFSTAESVMITSKMGCQKVLNLGFSSDKIVHLPYFINIKEYTDNLDDKKLPFKFVSCGRLIKRKGYDIAIKAFSIVKKEVNVPFEYRIIGIGPQKAFLEELCLHCGLNKYIQFVGWKEPQYVKEILFQSNAFIHPARKEPFGVVILEAMASGLPILGSESTGAVLDRVIDGKNGFIHSVGDERQLANQIKTFLTNYELAFRMGQKAKITANSWPIERGIHILKNVLNRSILL